MSTVNLFKASRQWATRPVDQRFWTLRDARDFCSGYAATAQEIEVDFGGCALVAGEDDSIKLALGDGRTADMTHWSFGQLARTAGAPAEYIRKLPAALAIQCVEHGLDGHFAGSDDWTRQALVHANGSTVLRSLTSDRYSRFWNWKVFDRLLALESDGWKVPPARPAGDLTPESMTRLATEADCLEVRKSGLSIKPGDRIAPAGIYASDHDMFAFLVNEKNRLDDGTDGGLSRGFFVSNSEVGAASLRVTLFNYRHVCGNHIVWGAENVMEVAVRHIGDVEGRFTVELAASVGQYLESSAIIEQERIHRAKVTILGSNDDEVLDAMFKAIANGRRNGLQSGLNLKILGQAIEMAKVHEVTDGNPYSVWGVANGLTRISQLTGYADDRNFLDRSASLLLQLAI